MEQKSGVLREKSPWVLTGGIAAIGILYALIVYAESGGGTGPENATTAATTQVIDTIQTQGILGSLYDTGSMGDTTLNPNATSRADVVVGNHFANYCGSPETGTNCPTNPLLQFGDAKVSTLLSATTYDQDRSKAVNQFLYNFIPGPTNNFKPLMQGGTTISQSNLPVSLPTSDPNSSLYPSPENEFADALSDQTLLSMARQAMGEMIAKRSTPAISGNSETIMAMMDRIATSRQLNKDWFTSVTNTNPISALTSQQMMQEQLQMQAFQVWLEYQRYLQMERVEALLSAMVVQGYRQRQAVTARLGPVGSTGTSSGGQ